MGCRHNVGQAKAPGRKLGSLMASDTPPPATPSADDPAETEKTMSDDRELDATAATGPTNLDTSAQTSGDSESDASTATGAAGTDVAAAAGAEDNPTTPSTDAKTDSPDEPTFAEMGLAPKVLEAVTAVGYESPSAIQASTIPLILAGRDVLGLAQTGTGKTAAFALPILSMIDPDLRAPQALILAPTRELALQVAEACVTYSAKLPNVSVLPIYGGQSYGIQLSGLRRGAQIIVGTPGRVIDHLEKGTLDLSGLHHLVLDEADEMLTMGFQEDVERILEDTPEATQVALFSATMPNGIRRISQKYLTDPAEVKVKAKTATASTINQRYVVVAHRDKLDALTRVLEVEDFDAMIMFVRTKQATEELAERLRARGFSAAAINGDIPQNLRERTIGQLKDGKIDVLVATDVAARGLDVPRISHVVNYDIPHDVESYVHRIGRTGRAGRSGHALLFVTPRERRLLSQIERSTRQPLQEIQLPSVDDVNEMRMAKFAESITASLEDSNLALFRRLVEEYAAEHSVPMEDIAAALATQSRNSDEFLMKEPERPRREDRRNRGDRGERGGDFGGRDRRDNRREHDRGPSNGRFASYRIAVGKRAGVKPGSIMGALANEAGIRGSDIGRIQIRFDHSLVELPADLQPADLESMRDIRIGGEPIDIRPDAGPPAGRPGAHRHDNDRGERGGRGFRGGRGNHGGRGRSGFDDQARRGGRRGDRRDFRN